MGRAQRPAAGSGANGLTLAGSSTVQGLVIDGFATGNGIELDGDNDTVQSNFIGTDSTGGVAVPNRTGVAAVGANEVIGGTTPAARNVISANTFFNVALIGPNALVEGNYIAKRRDWQPGVVAIGLA